MSERYSVTVEIEGDDFVVTCRDLPEVVTSGASLDEALRFAADAVEVAVTGRIDDEMNLPSPTQPSPGDHPISLPARLAAKAAVYRAYKRSGLRKTELARRMDRNEAEIRRILDPRHGTKLDQLEEAARALGGRLDVSFEAA